ncbi:transcriptional regulator [Labrenzia aggregata]|uniref:Transcriptional regulator n=1 Tax=Roseibium aggregatum TaxID=187304 RepID=A0A926P2L5_9HYPH|nr:transcriptional regulator [Roseibium aggregatum]
MKAARQARQIARNEIAPAELYVPTEIDVKAIRIKLRLTQEEFTSEFGFSVTQIRDWEQNRSRPLDGSRAYLMLIDNNPDAVGILLRKARTEMEKLADCEPAQAV